MRDKLDAGESIAVYLITHKVIVMPVCVDDVSHRLRRELTQVPLTLPSQCLALELYRLQPRHRR